MAEGHGGHPGSHPGNHPGNRPGNMEEVLRENQELRQALAQLQELRTLAYRDPLTGLWNRRYFDERLAEELSRTVRSSSPGLAVMMVDVNDLKLINDATGHAGGDRALRWVGRFLRERLRTHDVCCRIGGDEFAVILPDLRAIEAPTLVTRLRRELERASLRRGPSDRDGSGIGLSFGTATFPQHGRMPEQLVEVADAAMYRDKRQQKLGSRPTPLVTPSLGLFD